MALKATLSSFDPLTRRQQVVTGVADSLKEALEFSEDCALYYLSDKIEKVTVPLWIET